MARILRITPLGMRIKFQEFNVIPSPIKLIVVKHANKSTPSTPAGIHTVLFLTPEEAVQDPNADLNDTRQQLCAMCNENGRVSDPTFPQYDYDKNCHKTVDYCRDKVTNAQIWEAYFGWSYDLHKCSMLSIPGSCSAVQAHVLEGGIQVINGTVYRETKKLGGRRQLILQSSHEGFVSSCQQLVDAVRADLEKLRAEVDVVLFRWGTEEQVQVGAQSLMQYGASEGHEEVMRAFDSARGSLF